MKLDSFLQKISVVITSYNQKDDLKEAIESVLNQSYNPFEIIICDDASSDGSQDLIKGFEQKFPGLVKGIFHKKNLGIPKNRNSGLNAVQGDFVTWLDGDDIFRTRKLELEIEEFLADPDVKWVYSQVIVLDVGNNISHNRYKYSYRGMIFDKVVSMLGCAPRNPLIDFVSLKKVGFFKEDMEMYEDFDLCLRLAKFYKCSYRPEPLMEYRVHLGGIHKTFVNKHIISLQKLYNNLIILLEDESADRKQYLERCFLLKQNSLLIKKDIDERKRISALVRLFKKVRLNTWGIINPSTYVTLFEIILPTSIVRFISRLIREFQS